MSSKINLYLLIMAVSSGVCCAPEPVSELPPVAAIPEFPVTNFEWPWCSVSIPPVRDEAERCPASEIGASIAPEHVCQLMEWLKSWFGFLPDMPLEERPPDVRLDHWEEIEWIKVCQLGWRIHLIVHVPDLYRDPGAALDVDSGEIRFHLYNQYEW